MELPFNKPLYALTVGEFIQLLQETIEKSVPKFEEQEPKEKEEHFNIEQLRLFLNCSKVTIHNYKKRGLPYYRVGRKLLFKKSEVLEFMRKNIKRLGMGR
ncbi:MAG: DNA-binding protein [Bacteroidetes bacterium]|nr:MAG: DNA-binding protein [Bacteroidota bacterium]